MLQNLNAIDFHYLTLQDKMIKYMRHERTSCMQLLPFLLTINQIILCMRDFLEKTIHVDYEQFVGQHREFTGLKKSRINKSHAVAKMIL